MNYKQIKFKLNKVFENAAAGIVGIENLHDKKKPLKKYKETLDESGFKKLPKGWSKKSVNKTGKTLAKHMGLNSPKDKGFFDKCVEKMKDKMNNPEGYCASLKDQAHGGDKAATYWRGKEKSEIESNKQIYKMRRKLK